MLLNLLPMAEQQRGRRAIEVGPTGQTVATNIARLRDRNGMTTRQLSGALDRAGRAIPASGITRMEKGERVVTVDELVALAAVFGVSPVTLLLPAVKPAGGDVSVTGLPAVQWETAWRWMHGQFPASDEGTLEEAHRFQEFNRPYQLSDPAHEAYTLLRGRIEGAWHLDMDVQADGGFKAELTRRSGSRGSDRG